MICLTPISKFIHETKKYIKGLVHKVKGRVKGLIKTRINRKRINFVLNVVFTGIIIEFIYKGTVTWNFPRYGLFIAITMYLLKWLRTLIGCRNVHDVKTFEDELNKSIPEEIESYKDISKH